MKRTTTLILAVLIAAATLAATTFYVPANNAEGTLSATIDADDTTLVLTTGGGALFPSTYPYPISIDDEILKVTNRSSDTFTVERAQEDTVAAEHIAGATVELRITAKFISDLNTAVNAIEGMAIVSETDIDTEAEFEALLTDTADILTDNDANYAFLIDSAGTLGQVWTSDGDGKGAWASTGDMNSFTLAGDSGDDQTIEDGDTLSILGGNGIATVTANTDTITVSVDIINTTAETTADDADSLLIYDHTASALRRMTRANFTAGISGSGDDMGDVDTEVELETALTDVTDVFTSNDTNYAFLIDSAGTNGYVWTSDGSGKGGWAAAAGGDSLWTDSGTYIEADNTADVRVYDDGEAIRLSIPAINTDNLSSESIYGIFVNHYSQGANANSHVYGVKGHAVAETGASGTNDDYVGVSGAGYAIGESTLADRIVGLLGEVSVTTLAAANSAYCIYAAPITMSGSATSVYGLAIGDIDDGTTNNYAIHTGAGDVRLGDDVHIVGNLTVDGTYPGGGVTDFTDLGDVPSAYTDQAGKFVKVNSTEDGLEFAAGTAATFNEIVLRPRDSDPASASYATFDARNNHTVLDFDADSDEIAYWNCYLPAAYGGGGITVEIHYAMTSATSGNAVWTAAFENLADEEQDIDSDGFAAAQSVTSAASGTSGKVKRATIAFTDGAQMDSVLAGDIFRLQITRDANNASDTATGDAELLLVIIKETSS